MKRRIRINIDVAAILGWIVVLLIIVK